MSTVITHHHAHHFYDKEQEASSAKLGMWLFLVTEVLLFSGLFVGYTVIKTLNPEMWKVASAQLDWVLGSVNTLVLITSSWTVALAVRAAQTNEKGEKNGGRPGDHILAVGNNDVTEKTHKEVVQLIKEAGANVSLKLLSQAPAIV